MDSINRTRHKARRAYELRRIRDALLGVAPVAAVATIAALVGMRPWSALAFGIASCAMGAALLWYGRDVQRAVLPGFLAGLVPLVLALCANQFHSCGPSGCSSFCVPACTLGGLVAGLAVARIGESRRAGSTFWLAASGLALLTGAMGCACIGYAGLVGLGFGFTAGSIPSLVRKALSGSS